MRLAFGGDALKVGESRTCGVENRLRITSQPDEGDDHCRHDEHVTRREVGKGCLCRALPMKDPLNETESVNGGNHQPQRSRDGESAGDAISAEENQKFADKIAEPG